MLGRDMLSVGSGILLICTLVHCHHQSNGDDDQLNRYAWRVANAQKSSPTSQHSRRVWNTDNGLRISEEQNIQIPQRLPGEGDLFGSQRQSDQNGADRKFSHEAKEYLGDGQQESRGDQGEESSEDLQQSDPWLNGRQRYPQQKNQIDQILKEIERRHSRGGRRGDGHITVDGEDLQLIDATEGEVGFQQHQIPAILRKSRSFEEVRYEDDEQPSSESESVGALYKDYEKYEGVGSYKFHLEGADRFDEAIGICMEEGAYLAVANSKDEADVFVTLWQKHGRTEENDAYVGIHNRNPENVFRTLSGDSVASTGYLAWRFGEPDNKDGVEHCVSFFRYGGYRDISCNGRRPFICEGGE